MQAFPRLPPPAASSKGNASGWSGTVPDVLRKSHSSPFFSFLQRPFWGHAARAKLMSCLPVRRSWCEGRRSPGDELSPLLPCSPRVVGREPRQDAAVALYSISLMCCDSPAELPTHGAIYGEMKPGDTKPEACPRCPWPRAGPCGVLWVA